MNYVYDILINFQKKDFDFYEWNNDDNIIHIRKVPIMKINSDSLYKMVQFDFSVPINFLKKLNNRTEIFFNKGIKILKNICVFTDGNISLAIKFLSNGKKDKISRLLIDDNEDILDLSDGMELINVDLSLTRKIKIDNFKTRKEQSVYKFIKRELKSKDYDKLKYTYFECFNEEESDYDKIINKINFVLDNDWKNYYEKIYNVLNLSSLKKTESNHQK